MSGHVGLSLLKVEVFVGRRQEADRPAHAEQPVEGLFQLPRGDI